MKNTGRLADSLANLDFVMSMALPSDVPTETCDRHSFLAMVENRGKPTVFAAWNEAGLAIIIRLMCHAWADAGRPTAISTAREIAREAIDTHTSTPLRAATLNTLRTIVAGADTRAGLGP